MDGEPNGTFVAEFRGLQLRVSDGMMGVTLSISEPNGSSTGIPGCPSVKDAKRIARKEALKVFKRRKP